MVDLMATALPILVLLASAVAQDYPLGGGEDPVDSSASAEPRLVCYYSNWAVYRPGLARFTPENINPYLCTHVIYAFAALSEEFELQPFDPYNDLEQGHYRSFVGLKSHNPALKTLVAVGGWNEGSRRFSRLVESPMSRKAFVTSALRFLREHGFDGLDLDWEYPAFREGGNRTADKAGYALLIKELREAIEAEHRTGAGGEKLLLTVAVPATKEYIDGGFDVPQIARHADFLNLLTYDYHSAYEPEAQHHAPLHPTRGLDPRDEDTRLNVAWTVDYYISLGAPARKLVVGLPLYGRSYALAAPALAHGYGAPADAPGEEGSATREKGYLAYHEICQKVKDDEWEVEAPSPDLVGPYAHRGRQWVGFDDEEMLLNKARFILEKGLGGAMLWTLDNDDFRGLCTGEPSPLATTVRDALLGSNLIAGSSSSRRTVARSAGPQERSSDVRFDDEEAPVSTDEAPPRRRNTLRRLVQNRQAARNRQAGGRRINAGGEENAVFTTPSPPPTPDPGVSAFECEDEGFFNNPRDCRKYFWCLDSGPANLGVVAHAFTCPSGLHFNSGTESCDYPENVVCPVGSAGSSPAKKTTTRPRARATTTTRATTPTTTTTTTTTTTEPPTTTTTEEPEEPEVTQATPEGGENVAELLRLLQAIGGVERLQSLLGAQELQAESKEQPGGTRQYAESPRRTTTTTEAPAAPPRLTSPYLDPYDYVRPTTEDEDEDDEDDEEEDPDFRFQYNTPARGREIVTPGVDYAREVDDERRSPPSVPPYEAPLATPETPRGGPPYRTPIRVQVGRVVRVQQNGTIGNNNTSAEGQGGRRRMLVRVRPREGPAPTAEGATAHVTGRAVGGGDDKRLSGSTLLATRANPAGDSGSRVAVRRRPLPTDRTAEESHPSQGVRLVARRPLVEGANYITVRRRPTDRTTQTTTPVPTTRSITPSTTTTTTAATPSDEYHFIPLDNTTTDDEYDDEYEYEEYEDEATTTATTTTTTTTTTKRPAARPTASHRRGTVPPKSPSTVAPRSSARRGPAAAQQPSAAATTPRPSPPAVKSSGDEGSEADGPPVEVISDSEVVCRRRGVFAHPSECSKFVVCAPISRSAGEQGLKGRVLHCPANQIYLLDIGRCMKGDRSECRKL